ncbi:AaceriADL381Wp [[Ashbya] aceris (nom. inval.)]|nr:AaceriADL381Wp [[Ashbya] aceris (nom. inval.)]
MQCTICHRPSTVWYCAHCVNTSPKLILRYKLELTQICEEVTEMRDTVTSTLENAIGRKEGLLGKHMERLQHLRLKRYNARLSYRARELEQHLESKMSRRDGLRHALKQLSAADAAAAPAENPDEYRELGHKLTLLQNVVATKSAQKFEELRQWFAISCNTAGDDNFPYSIRFIPMCNIRNWRLLSTAEESLQHMCEFVKYASRALLVDMPFDSQHETLATDPVAAVSHFTVNLLTILIKRSRLQERPDVPDLLGRYDIDGLLYLLCSGGDVESITGICPPTYKVVHEFVRNALEDGEQSEERGHWMVLE